MKNLIKNFGLFFLIFLIIAVGFSVIEEGKVKNERVGIQEFVNQIEDEKIESVVIRGGEMEVVLRDGQKEIVKKEVGQTLTELLYDLGVERKNIQNKHRRKRQRRLAVLAYEHFAVFIAIFINRWLCLFYDARSTRS